jgi:hypothetical protein
MLLKGYGLIIASLFAGMIGGFAASFVNSTPRSDQELAPAAVQPLVRAQEFQLM